ATKQPVDAAWLSLKDGSAVLLSSLLDAYEAQSVEDLLASECTERERLEQAGKKNLANAVHALVRKVRNGEFSIRPLDCAYCEYPSVCRITERRLNEIGSGGGRIGAPALLGSEPGADRWCWQRQNAQPGDARLTAVGRSSPRGRAFGSVEAGDGDLHR